MMKRTMLIILSLIFVSVTFAAVINVPDSAATIQAAVDLASQGDTVLVAPGTYGGFSVSGKNLTLASYYLTTGDTSYISQTIISLLSPSVQFGDCYTDTSLICGFTLDGVFHFRCFRTNMKADHLIVKNTSRDGIHMHDNSFSKISNCIVENSADYGIVLEESDGLIENCVSSHNGEVGIRVYSDDVESDVQIRNCLSEYNGRTGIFVGGSLLNVKISKCKSFYNTYGGLWAAYHKSAYIYDSEFKYNTKSGGVHIDGRGATITWLENVLVTHNEGSVSQSSMNAGGITIQHTSPVLVNVTVAGNTADPLWGGGMYVFGYYTDCHPIVINSIFAQNSYPEVTAYYSNIHFAYSTISTGNQAQVVKKGYAGVYGTYTYNNLLNVDPIFDADYTLQSISPCIDAGAAYYEYNDSVYVDMSVTEYSGAAPDMGVYEYTALTPSIQADFMVHEPSEGTAPLSVQFIDHSTSEHTTINSWFWDFGDGHTTTEPYPVHEYTTPGTYDVSLTVSDGIISDTKTKTGCVTVHEAVPVAAFSTLLTSGFAPFQTVFKNETTGRVDTYSWDFGDGNTSTELNPQHTYQDTGKYTVQLIAENTGGADTLTRVNYIHVTQSTAREIFVSKAGSDDTGSGSETQPYLTIQKGIDDANANDIVTVLDGTYLEYLRFNGTPFTLRSINGPENCIIDCNDNLDGLWFQDDEPNTMVVQGFTVKNAYYGFKLEGSSPTIMGNIITACKEGIYGTKNWTSEKDSKPIIYRNLVIDNEDKGITLAESGGAYVVNNTIARNGEAGIEAFFAEVTAVNNIISTHEKGMLCYTPGEGDVSSSYNCLWNNATQYVDVILDSNDIYEDPLFVSATDFHLQKGSPCIDAGNPLFPKDPDGSIVDIGAFYTDYSTDTIKVNFAADGTNGTAPFTVVFSDRSEGDPTAWSWTFGDGGSASVQNPSHTYTAAGVYTVKLVASNDGDRDSLIKTDYITVREAVVHPPTLSGFNKIESVPGVEGDNFYQISAVSKDIAYLATNKNRIYKTTNGGESWTDITPQIQSNIVGATPKVNFINENIGSVALSVDDGGNDYDYSKVYGYVWCTRDGGQTWSQRFNVNQDQIHHLQQVTENIVYISGSAKLGVTSTRWFKKIMYDPSAGSYTLTSITPLPTSRPHVKSAHWLNQTTGIAVGQYNVYNFTTEIFKTVDGGSSWQSIQSNLPVFDYSRYMFADRFVQMLDEDTYVLVQTYKNSSGVYQCNIWRTDNGGGSWTSAHFDTAPQQLVAMKIADNHLDGIAVGYDSTKACYITHDGGFNWEYTELPDLGGRYLYGCDITSDGSTWINGSYRGLWTSSSELIADFTADVTSGSAPLEVHFTDLSQIGSGPITSWQWSFGDGENSLIQNPIHVYNAPGEYTVRLIVSDGIDSDMKEEIQYIRVSGSSHAVITAVEDVPADQGGWVTVHFVRSALDTDILDATRAAEDSLEMYTVEINDGSGWVSSNSTVAYGVDSYSILAHTPFDSSAASNGMLDFRVIAGMTEGNYSSPTEQGYSVDNLAPVVPTGLGAIVVEAAVQLDWDASLEEDLQYYNVYRSETIDFSTQGMPVFASVSENTFLDESIESDRIYYYRVTAVDFHGNESEASEMAAIMVAIVDIPDNFELAQNYPNPFNPTTTLVYALPEISDVYLTISSLTGRKIKQWHLPGQPAGWHEVLWDGKNISGNTVSTGIYIYTLKAGNFIDTRKMVFIK